MGCLKLTYYDEGMRLRPGVLNNPVRYIDPDGRAVVNPLVLYILYKTGKAAKPFYDNYKEMYENEVCPKHNDKYYHMKANYEASEQGIIGETTAALLSIAKEIYDLAKKGLNTLDDSLEDMKANNEGRRLGRENRRSGKDFEEVLPDNWRAMFEQH